MSKLSIGIIGLPNVGKSTLFNILTKQSVKSENYPFATIDPNMGVVPVPDKRLDELTKLSDSEKQIPAVVEFYDIAGLVKGANDGEGLGNKFLAHIQETDAILHIVRCFEGRNIIHVEGNTDPIRDIDIIENELILKDLQVVESNINNAEKKIKTGDKKFKKEYELLKKVSNVLDEGKLLAASKIIEDDDIEKLCFQLNLLTSKKQLFLLNGEESDISDKLKEKIKNMNFDYVIADLDNKEVIPDIIQKAYNVLNLISFFTTGEKESRAWTIVRGSTAPEAAGVIHSDFEKNFIRAEIVSYEKLIKAGSWGNARKNGDIRIEGKDYIMKDDDVVFFRVGR